MEEKDLMDILRQRARRALQLAIGVAIATVSGGALTTALADHPTSSMQSFRLPPTEPSANHYTSYPAPYRAQDAEADATENGESGEGEEQSEEEEEPSIEEQFEAFKSQLSDLEESIDEVAEVAGNKSIVVSGSSKSTMKVSGRVHFDAWGFDTKDDTIADINEDLDPQNRLGFRRLRFGVKGKVRDNMEYKIEMEFAGGNNVEFRDAYLGWNDLAILQTLLLGNQKRPYGLDHLNSSRYNVFLERPFVIEANNQDARRLGLCAYGVSDNERWNWRYGVFNQRNVQGLGNYIDDHLQLEVAGRLANTLWYDEISGGRGYAHWAVSGSYGVPDPDAINGNEARYRTRPEARSSNRWLNTGRIANASDQYLLGLEGVLNIGAFSVVGEYQTVTVARDLGLSDVDFDGGYVYVAYWLTGEHTPWERDSGTIGRTSPFENFWLVNLCNGCCDGGWGAWQIAGRWSKADYNDDDIFGGIGEAFTFGMNWWWSPNARVQFNYITGEITDRDTDSAGIVSGDYDIYGARWMIDF